MYDLELIDIDPSVSNFEFTKVTEDDLQTILKSFKFKEELIKFNSFEGSVLLERRYFRGVIYDKHIEPKKSIAKETMENAVPISTIKTKKKGVNNAG